MSQWKKVCIALGLAVILGTAYLWFFGVRTFFAVESRKIARQIPIVKSVPGELRDLSVSNAPGEKLSFMGIEFELPWDDVDQSKSRVVGNWAFIVFRSGNSIIVCVSKPKDFMNGVFRDKAASPELFTQLYGPEILNSDYALKKAIYQTTPRTLPS
jgi:hypothetical protein